VIFFCMQATMASKRFRRPVPSFALLARAGPTSRGLINRVAGSVAALRTEPASPRRGRRPTAHAAPRSPLFSRPARSLRSPIIAPPRRWRRHHGLRHRGVRAQANQSSTPPALAPRPLVKPPTQASEMKGPHPPQKTGPCPLYNAHPPGSTRASGHLSGLRAPFRPRPARGPPPSAAPPRPFPPTLSPRHREVPQMTPIPRAARTVHAGPSATSVRMQIRHRPHPDRRLLAPPPSPPPPTRSPTRTTPRF
jgi:hypothetical protein